MSKSAQTETPTAVSAATTSVKKTIRVAAKSNAFAASPLQTSRLSLDRSLTSKPAHDRRSLKLTTPSQKKATRVLKPPEVQAELSLAQEELKKAKEKLLLVENEKEKAFNELKQSQRLAEEANEKLREALVAQKRAEEKSEIEKFRADEIEQAGIESSHQKEEEWQKALQTVRNQHTADASALLSATQEVRKVKQELALITDAKDQALQRAENATKIAEAHAQEVEALSAELVHMKSVLDSIAEMEAIENDKLVSELKLEIDSLNQELEKARMVEEKLAEKEANLEQLTVELEAAKMAESYAHTLVDELQERVKGLDSQAEQAKRTESESLESVRKQLEGSNGSLRDTESQIGSLKEKMVLLEICVERQKRDLEESDILLELAKEEASDMAKKVESLRSELETLKEERTHYLDNEKLAAESVQTLLEEKNKLIEELDSSRDEEEKSKKALESLASALHEVSSEARDAKEKKLSFQVEHENCETQIEDLKLVLKATNEKYESMLDDAKQEIDALTTSIEQSKEDQQNLKDEWEQHELHLMNSIKKSEEERSSMENDINRLVNLIKTAEEEACTTREEEERWKTALKEAEKEAMYLKEVLGEAKMESMRLKEGLMDRENEVQNILHENDELRKREASSLKKIEELSTVLEEALAKNQPAPAKEAVHEVISDESVQTVSKMENANGRVEENNIDKDDHMIEAEEVDLKMWNSCKIEEKDNSGEGEEEGESFEEHKAESTDSNEHQSAENVDNGESSHTKQNIQKKKKPLLSKFGSLFKKGTTNNK